MDGIIRRREMSETETGPQTEVWFDVTKTSESGTLNTAEVGSAIANRFNSGDRPSKVYIRFYLVTPLDGTSLQAVRLCFWRSGTGMVYNFVHSTNTSGRYCNGSADGSDLSMEAVCTHSTGEYYDVTWSTNNSTSGTRATNARPFRADSTGMRSNCFFTARSTSSNVFGVGTRLQVIAEYGS